MMPMKPILTIPDFMPLSAEQRAWLQGYYAGMAMQAEMSVAAGSGLSSFAVELARSWFGAEDEGDILAQSTLLSSVMFMTYEMVKAEVEAKELEDLIG